MDIRGIALQKKGGGCRYFSQHTLNHAEHDKFQSHTCNEIHKIGKYLGGGRNFSSSFRYLAIVRATPFLKAFELT